MIATTVATTLIVVVVGTLLKTPTYEASTTLRVLTAANGPVDSPRQNVLYAERLMTTYSELVTSSPVLEELAQKLGLDEPPDIQVEAAPNSELIEIVVEDPSPYLARDAANGLAEILVAQNSALYAGVTRTARDILDERLAQVEGELSQAQQEYEQAVAQSPADAERIQAQSRAVALKQNVYSTLLQQYEKARVTEAIQTNTLSIAEPASTPLAPSMPHKALDIGFGVLVGMMGGVGLTLLFENLDATLQTTEQIQAATGLPALAQIPVVRRPKQQPTHSLSRDLGQTEPHLELRTKILAMADSVGLACLLKDRAPLPHTLGQTENATALSAQGRIPSGLGRQQSIGSEGRPWDHEAYRRLCTSILALAQEGCLHTVVITSVGPGEGNSTIVSNLARAMADAARRIVVVDADLRRPALHRLFGLSNAIGLSSVLKRRSTLLEAVQESPIPEVWVLTSGPVPSNPARLLGSPQMRDLMTGLAQEFDVVLLDTPSLLAATDAAVLAPMADGVLLVVGRAQTEDAVRVARQQLADARARVLGVVVNRAPLSPQARDRQMRYVAAQALPF